MAELHVAPGTEEPLAQIDRRVVQLFALVGEAVAGSTLALLTGDRAAAEVLVANDQAVDELYQEIEGAVLARLVSGQPAPAEIRYLVGVLRMLPELERSGDLAEHVARRAMRYLSVDMSARSRGLIERMGEVASAMWTMAADAYCDRGPEVAEQIDELDDEMDELLVMLLAEIVDGGMPLPACVQLALVGRFYERLGDHAVNLTRRVRAWTTISRGPPAG